MPPQRLPIVNSDDGTWGDIIRQYLMKEHYNDDSNNAANGGHQFVTIRPGTTSAAPLTLSSGPLRTTPAIGAIEFNGNKLYFTQTTGTVRKTVAIYDDASGATGDIYYRNSGGDFTRLGIGSTNNVLTVSGGLPVWQAPAVTSTFSDSAFTLQDNGDTTKQLRFEVSGISTATTRTLTAPNANTTIVGTDATQTLTNKTINLANNTLTGTTAQFNTALSDNLFATQAGTETLTNKTLSGSNNTFSNIPQSAVTNLVTDLTTKQAKFMTGTVATAAATAAKTVTLDSPWASVTPSAGDFFILTYTSGTTVSTATIAINGDSARNVRLANANASNAVHQTAAGGQIIYYFDGTYYQMLGSQVNSTYSAITDAEIINTASTTARLITGQRAETLMANEAGVTRTLTNKTLTGPRINQINDVSGNNVLDLIAIPSASNYVYITNQSAGNYPTIGVDGGDTNMGVTLAPKGSGPVRIGVASGQTPTLDVAGPDANMDLNLVPKGSGRVKADNVTIPTISSADTLSNKTISASNNTITNIGLGSLSATGTPSSSTYLRGDNTWATIATGGDASTNTATSVDSEVALFSGTGGKTLKRATGTGIAKLTAGVLSIATAGTDYSTSSATETLTNKTLTAPRFASGGFIADNSGNEQIVFTTTASAVNEIGITNAATGNAPSIASRGGDTNVNLDLVAKGTGVVRANNDGTAREVVTISGAQTLTNKTISGSSNTLSNIPQSAVTNLTTDLAGKAATSHTHTASQISDSTTVGRSVLTAVDAAAARTAIGAGTGSGDVTLTGAQTLTNKTLTAPVINGTVSGTGVAVTPTGSTLALRDASGNLNANALSLNLTSIATAAGTTVMTIASPQLTIFTGTSTQTVRLPTTSVTSGTQYRIANNSTGAVTVQSSAANTITVLAAGTSALFSALIDTPTANTHWEPQYFGSIISSGKSLTVSQTLTLAGTDGTTMTFPNTSGTVVTTAASQTLTTKTINLSNNTLTGTTAQFNAALSDGIFVTEAGAQTLTNKTLTTPTIASFTNATHNHTNAAGGGQLNLTTASNATGTPSSSTYLRGDNTWATIATGGDASTNTATSVDSEVALFSGTGGKTLKRATGTGIATLTSGVLSTTATTGSGNVVLATSPTLTTPNLGTPSALTLTNATGLPISGITSSTSTALGVGSLEIGHATDTTLSRSSAGVLAVEGVVVPTISSTNTLTNKTINLANNTLTGTTAQFNAALSDNLFATQAGTETLTNKTMSGSNNTFSNIPLNAISGIDNISKLVVTTQAGSTGTENGANTWAQIATFSTGTNQYSECQLILSVATSNSAQFDTALVSVYFRSNGSGQNPTVNVKIMASGGTGSMITSDSYLVISDGWSSDMQLWFKKGANYGVLNFYETSRSLNGGTLTYTTNPGWQSSTPTGTVNNVSSNGTFSGLPMVVNGSHSATQLISTVSTGTAPLTVSSTTRVTNFNADLLDDMQATSANTGNTVVSRDSNGDINVRYANSSYASMSHSAAARNSDTVFYSSTDNYIRKNTAAGFKTSLALDQVDNTSDATKNSAAATLTNKTLTAPVFSGTITGTYTFGGTPTWPTFNQNTTGSAATLTTARTIGLSGGATGTATSFNGSANITIPVTALNADSLSAGTLPDARMTGTYTNFTHRIDGANTIFTTPNSGSTNNLGRTVYGLAEYRSNNAAQTGAIVFYAPNTTSSIMHQLEISGLLYNQNIVQVTVQGYRTTGAWNDTRKISTGTVDVQVRWGVDPSGKNCLILGDVGTSWSYPHLSIVRAMFSHTGASDAYATGWTVGAVTDLTGFTQITSDLTDSAMVGSITGNAATANTLQTARTIGGVSFNGSANINLPGVNTTGNQNTTGSAATLTTTRTLQTNLASTTAASFNGSANASIGVTGTLPVGNGGTGVATLTGIVKGNGTSAMSAAVAGTDYSTPAGTETLTNKTINGSNNTLSNIPQSAVTNLTTDLAGKAATSHTHTATQISDSTAVGRSVLTAVDAAAARTAIGAGTGSGDVTLTGAQTLTNKTFNDDSFTLQDGADNSKKIVFSLDSMSTASTITLSAPNVSSGNHTLVVRNSTDVLINKRVKPRITTITSSATPSFNTNSCDFLEITALATNITSMTSSMTGAPDTAEKLMIRIKDDGTARSITWGASWRGIGVSLPVITTPNKTLYVGAVYNATDSIWDVVAVEQQA